MDRREILRLAPNLFWLTLLGTKACKWTTSNGSTRRLFFDPEDIRHIQTNANSPLLQATFQEWASYSDTESREILQKPLETGDLIRDLGITFRRMEHLSLVYLVTEEKSKLDLIKRGIEVALELPKWDYFLDGDSEMGVMRASQGVGSMLFVLEVLEDKLTKPLVDDIYEAVADKGTEPCNVAIWGMDNPDKVKGWHADEKHSWRYYFDMSRWPQIFSGNNLRAVPTMGLGLGALALEGRDDRAGEWLDRAVQSAQTYLAIHEPDGSYDEGLSYVNYACMTLFGFLEAYDRLKGDVNWLEYANFKGINNYIAAMQAGRQYKEDVPDIVNFSDARGPTTVAVNSWLARHTEDPLAQYNAEHFSHCSYYADFLWYSPDLPSAPPSSSLKNVRLDLDWIVSRSGWGDEDAVLAFRSGKPANHEHADRNSFIYKAYGERLLTDQFGASYEYTQPHWLLRQTEAHNAALVDGKGHQYVDGSEGTNAGKAVAEI
ncbi:MAG: heparinase II/III family protein, partial [Bacteroidetes bacterium]|nr:heparinase II/III family protein [Bacteroidota bacterium]